MLQQGLMDKGGKIPTLADLGMPHDPASRGYHSVYRDNETNHCPGCGRTQWIIGRVSAECAFCSTAIPLAAGLNQREPDPVIIGRGKGGGKIN